MKSLCNAALMLVLCAASAGALGKGQISAHTHDTAGRGGSTLRPVVLSMTAASTASLAGVVSVPATASCSGLSCRVGYSSGTLNTFSFVLNSTATYVLHYSVSVTSGVTTVNAPFYCQINGDATAANYGNMLTSYSSPYNINNLGADARWGLCADGGVQVSAGEGCSGAMTMRNLFGTSNNLIMSGQAGIQLITPGATNFQAQSYSGLYVGNAPWTLTCTPVAGVGWIHEAILYQVGK